MASISKLIKGIDCILTYVVLVQSVSWSNDDWHFCILLTWTDVQMPSLRIMYKWNVNAQWWLFYINKGQMMGSVSHLIISIFTWCQKRILFQKISWSQKEQVLYVVCIVQCVYKREEGCGRFHKITSIFFTHLWVTKLNTPNIQRPILILAPPASGVQNPQKFLCLHPFFASNNAKNLQIAEDYISAIIQEKYYNI